VAAGGGPKFALDNSAISNLAAVERMDIVRERYGGQLVVTREVLLETERGPCPEVLRWAVKEGWVELRIIYADSEEHGVFAELRDRGLGLGEASLIAVCSTGRSWVFVSDDLDARREAGRRGVGVVGTYGILARQVAEGKMRLEEGNELLQRMMDRGFRSHSDDLGDEVERLAQDRGS
jgi:predicted nucleic acid-binding protein